jgi:hypothetical protein
MWFGERTPLTVTYAHVVYGHTRRAFERASRNTSHQNRFRASAAHHAKEDQHDHLRDAGAERQAQAPARADPQLLDHRPHRPRQEHARRSHPRAHIATAHAHRSREAGDSSSTRWTSSASAGSRSRPRPSASSTRPKDGETTSSTSSTPPATSTSTTRCRAACRLRGRAPRRRRVPGRRGADARQRLPRDRQQPRDHPGPQQDRPAVRGPTRVKRADRGRHRARLQRRAAGLAPRPASASRHPRGDREAHAAAPRATRGRSARSSSTAGTTPTAARWCMVRVVDGVAQAGDKDPLHGHRPTTRSPSSGASRRSRSPSTSSAPARSGSSRPTSRRARRQGRRHRHPRRRTARATDRSRASRK